MTPTLLASHDQQYKKKLYGWLTYAFASEVFVIVSLTLFLPICLEQFARDNGFILPTRTVPCTIAPINSTSNPHELVEPDAARCVVKIGWLWIDTASFSLYVYSISVFLQALTVISMGGIADHPPHRLPLLLSFAFVGAISASTFLLLPSKSILWLLAAPLAVFANIGFGASVVAMNAYLPGLARDAPDVRGVLDEIRAQSAPGVPPVQLTTEPLGADSPPNSNESARDSALLLLPTLPEPSVSASPKSSPLYTTTLARTTARISAWGIALGYAAGIILLVLALVPVTKLHGSTAALRGAVGASGVWWGVGTGIAGILLKGSGSEKAASADSGEGQADIGGEEWDDDESSQAQRLRKADEGEWNAWREILAAWKRLGGMLHPREIKKLWNTFRFLAAWFLLSDGFSTLTSTALLFAKTTLHLPSPSLILIGILTPLSGIAGALAWPILQRRCGWSNLRVLVGLVALAGLVPMYGCVGFLWKKGGAGTLTTQGEMFALAVYFGSVYGAFQSYARAFYAELLPEGEEARWFGLYSITDKSSSFLGPLIVGLIADATGNIRYAFFFLVFMIWLAIPVLAGVNVEVGRNDARKYRWEGRMLEEREDGESESLHR